MYSRTGFQNLLGGQSGLGGLPRRVCSAWQICQYVCKAFIDDQIPRQTYGIRRLVHQILRHLDGLDGKRQVYVDSMGK